MTIYRSFGIKTTNLGILKASIYCDKRDRCEINYLRESDLEIEFQKVRSVIYKRIDESVNRMSDRLTIKLDDLLKRTEIVFTRISEYSHQKSLNPNLKIKNKTGYSLSDV